MKATPTLRQMRYLVAVAEHLHFGRAAEACFVTQSTLSAGLQEMEALLGVTLVERSRRKVTMTALGLEIARRARGILRAAEDLTETAEAAAKPLCGELRLGVIPTIGPYLLPRALPALQDAYAELRVLLSEEQTASVLKRLRQGALDTALIALPYDTEGLECMVLGADGLVVAMAEGHPWAGRSAIDEATLKEAPLLLLEDGHCLREHALTACRLAAGRYNEVFQATSMSTLMQMVAAGLGVTLLPELAVTVEAGPGRGIATVPLAGARRARDVALCWRQGSPRGGDYRAVGELIKRHMPHAGGK